MTRFISLKARILISFGSLIIFLMLIISLSVLYQWRKLIISDLIKNTEAIAQSFSFSVLDALIYQENNLQSSEGYLQSYIQNYAAKNARIKYISVTNAKGSLVAHSDILALFKKEMYPEPIFSLGNKVQTTIFKHSNLGWIIEIDYPLLTGDKNWGVLQIAFNSEPTRQAIRKLYFLLISLTSASVLIVLFLLFYFANRLTSTLSELVKNMDQYDPQNPEQSPLPVINDETGYLMHHFEEMKNRLSTSNRELLSAQNQIFQAEKLASVGRLASGVAHEINNPLNGIKNCLYVLQRHPNDPTQRNKYLPLIDEGLNHIETIVKKLLNFSRKDNANFRSVYLNKEVELVLSLLEYRLNEKQIQIHSELQNKLPAIEADTQLIQEILMNLLINALDAVDANGHITIKTSNAGQNKVELQISDDGAGIHPDNVDKIFDPFFTTKEEGKGTGLGLSVSLGIIEAHNGTIAVDSQDGLTSFIIQLPIMRHYENPVD